MVKRYIRLKAPEEFSKWIDRRKVNIEDLARELGKKREISKMDAMRLISKSDGIDVTKEMIRKIRRILK